MALKTTLALVFVAVMTITSIAEAQNPLGIIHVNGTLYCSLDGSSGGVSTTPVFPNAQVQVACTTDVISNLPVSATTDSNGVYLLRLTPQLSATVSSIIASCRIFVLTPLASCNIELPSVGLVSDLEFVKTVPDGSSFITYMIAKGFSIQG